MLKSAITLDAINKKELQCSRDMMLKIKQRDKQKLAQCKLEQKFQMISTKHERKWVNIRGGRMGQMKSSDLERKGRL
jgi:hypothetical protein